jgi:drug/metabolite transporter (DMT)-like permease
MISNEGMSIGYALALLSAVFYGAGDFVGGVTSRQASSIVILVVSQLAGLVVVVPLLPFFGSADLTSADLLWSGLAGLAGGTGVALLYRALAVGTMAVVAPVSASLAVVVPVGADISGGTRLEPSVLVGIVLALVAIILVGQARGDGVRAGRGLPPGLVMALLSGVAIGLFFLLLARTSTTAGLWPIAIARLSSLLLFTTIALGRGPGQFRLPGRLLALAAGGGVLDMAANALYLVASRHGALSVVVTLAALYPASTVVLGRLVLHERLTVMQQVGVGVAFVAIALIASATS